MKHSNFPYDSTEQEFDIVTTGQRSVCLSLLHTISFRNSLVLMLLPASVTALHLF
jgi:uncharacterized membrane protein